MNLFLRIDINIITAILLSIVCCTAYKCLNKDDKTSRMFCRIALIDIIQLIIEALTCIIDGYPVPWLIPIAKIMHILLFLIGPTIIYLWFYFIWTWILPDKKVPLIKISPLVILFIANAVVTILSYHTGTVFDVTGLNEYRRGSLFFVPMMTAYACLIYSCIIVLRYKRKLGKREFSSLLCFSIFPSIGGTVQVLYYGPLLIWSSTAIALIVVFIYLQQNITQIDVVTGAWTRAAFENHIKNKLCKSTNENGFGILFLDLDKFKKINDSYGHMEGDKALKQVVNIIKKAFDKQDIVARFGGDEFVVLINSTSKFHVKELISRMEYNFRVYNEMSGKPYELKYSYGYEFFNYKHHKSVGQFLNYVDGLMYKSKEAKMEYDREQV